MKILLVTQILLYIARILLNLLLCDFFMSRGFSELPQVTVNGVVLELEDEDLQNAIVNEVQHQTSEIQQLVYRRRITDSTNIYNHFMSKPNVLQRLNKHVANLDSLKVDLSGVWSGGDLPLTLLTKAQLSAAVATQMNYLTSKEGEFTMKLVSLWVVSDLSTSSGRQMILNVLKFMETKDTVRVGIIDNPSSSSLSLIHQLSVSIIQSQRPSVAIQSLTPLLSLEDGRGLENEEELVGLFKDIEKFKMAAFEKRMKELGSSSVFEYQREFLKRVLQLEPGASAILSNGR
uniref:UDP-glucose:glycoprotein glucosyltransferase thioredoxin-like domain-containing protein n=1 Tax=Amphimedon queenslandica TaxID=400682 RepID=A0A1X7THH3_AMPQE